MTHRNNQHTSRLRLRHPYLADMEQFRPPQQGGNEPLGADLFTMPKIPNIEKPYVPFHRDQYDQVLAAVKKQGLALKYASDRLKADPRIVETAVRQNGAALAYAPSNFRDDRTTVRAAVQQSGMALEFASPQFQKDRSIVLEAVAVDGMALMYAAPSVQGDREVCWAAVREDPWSLTHCAEDIRNNDLELVLMAVRIDGNVIQLTSANMKARREVVTAAVENYGLALEEASDELKADREVVRLATTQMGCALKVAPWELRSDRELVLLAVKTCPRILSFVPSHFWTDLEVMTAVFECLASNTENGPNVEWYYDDLEDEAFDDEIIDAMDNVQGLWDYSLCAPLRKRIKGIQLQLKKVATRNFSKESPKQFACDWLAELRCNQSTLTQFATESGIPADVTCRMLSFADISQEPVELAMCDRLIRALTKGHREMWTVQYTWWDFLDVSSSRIAKRASHQVLGSSKQALRMRQT